MTLIAKTCLTVLLCLQLSTNAQADESDDARFAEQRAATVACQERLSEALRAERTPLMDALAVLQHPSRSLGGSGGVAARSKSLEEIARRAPNDVLVQWLAAAAAAETNRGAELTDAAKALLRLEPDNGAVWLFPLQTAWIAEDSDAVTEALVQISLANRFDRHFGDVAVQGFKFLKKHPSPCASHMYSSYPMIKGMYMARAVFYWPVGRMKDNGALDRMCGGEQEPLSVARIDACIAAGRRIAEVGAMPESRWAGMSFLRFVAADEFAANSAKLDYLNHEYAPIHVAIGVDDDQTRLFELDMLDTHNAIEVMQRALLRAGKPAVMPVGWKPPYAPSERLETRIP